MSPLHHVISSHWLFTVYWVWSFSDQTNSMNLPCPVVQTRSVFQLGNIMTLIKCRRDKNKLQSVSSSDTVGGELLSIRKQAKSQFPTVFLTKVSPRLSPHLRNILPRSLNTPNTPVDALKMLDNFFTFQSVIKLLRGIWLFILCRLYKNELNK